MQPRLKRLISTILLLFIFCYIIEISNFFGFNQFKPSLAVAAKNNQIVLSWVRLPYPAYYEIEALSNNPDSDIPIEQIHTLTKYRTWRTKFIPDPNFSPDTYWRVTAQGLFHRPLGQPSNAVSPSQFFSEKTVDSYNNKPAAISPAPSQVMSDTPMIIWKPNPTAVSYELEILTSPPENPNGTTLSQHHLFSTQEVYTHGYQLDLSNQSETVFYWRVRALDYYGNPLGIFSDASKLVVDHTLHEPVRPIINAFFNQDGMSTPLYPVYSWIPIQHVSGYEVEILNAADNSHGTEPSPYRIDTKVVTTGNDCYDETPRITPGTYYWRVRGFDESNQPVGEYSDCAPFIVDLNQGAYSATFGDSITHGGGAISYSPADWEYSYQTYFQFPSINLGKSGDTSATMLQRFDSDVLPFHPQFLLIMGGSNSLRGGVPASDVIGDLSEIRDKCLENGIRPIFLTLPPINPANILRAFDEETVSNWKEQFDQVNHFIRSQRYFIDISPYMTDGNGQLPEYYGLDGLHPDRAGKKLMGQIINANWSRVSH